MMTAILLTSVTETLRQINYLRSAATEWSSFWNGLTTVVYASEDAVARQERGAGAQTEQNDFRWQGRIAQGRAIEIKGVNGEIRAEATNGNEVEVTASKRGRRSDPSEVRLQVVEHAGGVTICAVYPNGEADKPNTCEPGDGGHMSVRNNDVKVDFTIRVPQGVRFIGRTVNGEVAATRIGSDVEAYTVNGGINVSASGIASARTVNGSINASLGRSNWTGPLEFKTVNGSINLDLPTDLSTEFVGDTVNGDITSDFPMTVQGRLSRRHLQGTIGSGGGGRELAAKTINGSIKLRRAQ
ncbi:MAG TPA: DUF4097 family beta strand repeat-containing protein [Pyrinomonadaceae bacterium]|jgi:hypothetical protein